MPERLFLAAHTQARRNRESRHQRQRQYHSEQVTDQCRRDPFQIIAHLLMG